MEIGIIGLGGMGQLYARKFAQAGYRVNAADLPERKAELTDFCKTRGITLMDEGKQVSAASDLIVYSVPPFDIREIAKECGPHTKKGAIVTGQTSIKTPEVQAFEAGIPREHELVLVHSLHGPSLDTSKGTLVTIPYRASEKGYAEAKEVFSALGSKMLHTPRYQHHDEVTAETQVATHLPFLSMGTAWMMRTMYPWENGAYVSGIDNAKILMMLRMFGGQDHVYASLAMLNPFAERVVREYSRATSDLFHRMISGREGDFRELVLNAGKFVFDRKRPSIGLDEKILEEYSMGNPSQKRRNNHYSILSMVLAWHRMKRNPYESLDFGTPPFKLRLGGAEYLFTNGETLEESMQAAIHDKGTWEDDLEFFAAVRDWSTAILEGNQDLFLKRFREAKEFFKERIPEGKKKSDELIERLKL
jgi:prephenate dehydrogenase (NADP+)